MESPIFIGNVILTKEALKKVCPLSVKIDTYLPFLNTFMNDYEITRSLLRIRHFIAQVAHESAQFNYNKEIASGEAYEGRKDLGNINKGDGVKFKGRGLIQITGRDNYALLSDQMFRDDRLLKNPEILEEPSHSVESACIFWWNNNLNDIADTDDIRKITKIINGGYNGLGDRKEFYARCTKYIF